MFAIAPIVTSMIVLALSTNLSFGQEAPVAYEREMELATQIIETEDGQRMESALEDQFIRARLGIREANPGISDDQLAMADVLLREEIAIAAEQIMAYRAQLLVEAFSETDLVVWLDFNESATGQRIAGIRAQYSGHLGGFLNDRERAHLRAFRESETGQRIAQRLPQINQQLTAYIEEFQGQYGLEAIARIEAELNRDLEPETDGAEP